MSYTAINIPNLDAGETGYRLDSTTGPCVACKATVMRDAVTHAVSCTVTVRVVTARGVTVVDALETPIVTAHTRSCVDPQYLAAVGGVAGLVRQTLEIVLGEPSAIVVANDNIRSAILAAGAVTSSYNLSTLN